jgi:GntR family transcriptional repressor for pyruvate dehydrogenase complex
MTGMQAARHTSRVKRSDLIAEELKRWTILAGKGPGDRLPQEKELMEMFGCSRGTMRETLKVLEVEGLVEVVTGPQGGARLTRVPEERAMQLLTPFFYFRELKAGGIYATRLLLEPLMVRAAIDHLTDHDFAALRQTIEICRKGMVGLVDVASHRAAEIQFHTIIANRVPNILLRFYCLFANYVLYAFVTPKAVAQGANEPFGGHVVHAHEDIVDALAARDAERAVALMIAHLREAADMVEDIEMSFDKAVLEQSLPSSLDLVAAMSGTSIAAPVPSAGKR